MNFVFTPDEVQTLATELIKFFRKGKYSVDIEKALNNDAPCRTTLVVEKSGIYKAIECQKTVNFDVVSHLAQWLAANRVPCELFIATNDEESQVSSGELICLRKYGVGLIVYHDGNLSIPIEAKNYALVVNLDPALKLGKFSACVSTIISEFNRGGNSNRKSALRELCELVEGETERLMLKGIKKGIIVGVIKEKVEGMDWSDQINFLARKESYSNRTPLFDENLRNDFHSFRGARNLIDHKVRTKQAEARRQMQYVERMHQGPRLLNDLLILNRKIK